jgi:hypothetical protein
MNLDVSFVIASSLLVAAVIPLYIYREKVFPFIYKGGDFNNFIQDIKLHLKKEYPKVKFDFNIAIEKTNDEKNIKVRETLAVDELIKQFFDMPYEKRTQGTVAKEKLWSSYMEFSKSNPKYPNDWSRRKELSFSRDKGKCDRCGTSIKLTNSSTSFVKDIHDGGGYNLENIIILCSDCNSIVNSKNPVSTIHNLQLNDHLLKFVTN